MFSMFKEENGQTSMRRVCAFLFAIVSVGCGIFSVVNKMDWQVILGSFLAPAAVSVLLLFFTTWTDVSGLVKAVKGQ